MWQKVTWAVLGLDIGLRSMGFPMVCWAVHRFHGGYRRRQESTDTVLSMRLVT